MTTETKSSCELTAMPELAGEAAVQCSAGFDDPWRRYSVICDKADRSRHVVATGLRWSDAVALRDRLDREYQERIESAGQHYSSWRADLHECQLESPNTQTQQRRAAEQQND